MQMQFHALLPLGPERDQSEIPLFDTDVIDAGFAQLFNANEYAGWDRVGETNQVSAAVTTRFIDSETGLEWFKAGLGQRYYFNDQRTAIDGTRIRMDDSKGDLLATVGARLTRNINASAHRAATASPVLPRPQVWSRPIATRSCSSSTPAAP